MLENAYICLSILHLLLKYVQMSQILQLLAQADHLLQPPVVLRLQMKMTLRTSHVVFARNDPHQILGINSQ